SWAEWKRPIVAIVLTFLCNVESSMLAMGEWPYMSTIDEEATASFFGYATAANKAGHVLFAFIFAVWAHKISSIKFPMLVGRCVTLIACVMYFFVEFIPSNRRWWMLFCYLLFGVGFGTSPLLRSYVARTTTEENRSTAYALQNGAMVLSVIVGPIAQLSFAGLPYPGAFVIPPNIKLNIYTAPIWFACVTNVIAIVVTIIWLQDPQDEAVQEMSTDKPTFSIAAIKERLARLRTLNLPWPLIGLVLFEKMVSGLFNSTMPAIAGPLLTAMFALPGQSIVLLMGIAQILVSDWIHSWGGSSKSATHNHRVSCRVLFVFSNLVVIASYVITFPYPFVSSPLQPYNATTRTGCNPLEYSWCDSQMVMSIYPFIIALTICSSFALPSAAMSLDTIYSKMIGNIDQNVMQSAFVIADDIIQIVGPIYGSAVFTAIGINYINIINGIVYIAGTVLWLAAWRWLKPYN
ncbi:hypothetical protein PENTCL1PPCAC_14299, partial [Pristionchus entomophagus]